jgi:hypothetical protein
MFGRPEHEAVVVIAFARRMRDDPYTSITLLCDEHATEWKAGHDARYYDFTVRQLTAP